MKNTQKTAMCEHCGQEFYGSADIDVVREEMDHYRLYHPEHYDIMMSRIPLRKLWNQLTMQIHRA